MLAQTNLSAAMDRERPERSGRDLRPRVVWFRAVGLGLPLCTPLVALIVSTFSPRAAAALGLLAMAIYLLAFAVVSARLLSFRCPRCHHRWVKALWFNPFRLEGCAHCRLPAAEAMGATSE